MKRITRLWRNLRAIVRHRRVQLTLSIRVTIAALVALALAQLLQIPLPLWAVMTAVIVTQMSVGRSLKATFDYLAGTLGGAIYGGAIGVLIPHSSEIALLAVLAFAVAPLAFIAAINPRFSVAPITAIIVLLIPIMTHASPLASALDRVMEVALGGITGLIVSFFFLPSNAHPLVVAAAARTLNRMARALGELLAGLTHGLDMDALHRIQDGIGQTLVQMNAVGAEAEHERSVGLAVGPDTGPLLRTLLRLRHDLVMVGRAAITPLPEAFATRLASPIANPARPLLITSGRAGRRCWRVGARRRLIPWKPLLMPFPAKWPRSVARVSREVFPPMRRNTSSHSDSCSSRCTTTSRISNGAWLNGLDRPRKQGATTNHLIDPRYHTLRSRVAVAEARGSNPFGRASSIHCLTGCRRTSRRLESIHVGVIEHVVGADLTFQKIIRTAGIVVHSASGTRTR